MPHQAFERADWYPRAFQDLAEVVGSYAVHRHYHLVAEVRCRLLVFFLMIVPQNKIFGEEAGTKLDGCYQHTAVEEAEDHRIAAEVEVEDSHLGQKGKAAKAEEGTIVEVERSQVK